MNFVQCNYEMEIESLMHGVKNNFYCQIIVINNTQEQNYIVMYEQKQCCEMDLFCMMTG